MGAKGEKERGQTARQPRNTQQTAGAEDKRREGRKGGERGVDGLAPGEWTRREEEGRKTAERANRKKEYVIYLRERREKNTAETRKHTHKQMNIHCTKYRGVSAVYCTFFYIY